MKFLALVFPLLAHTYVEHVIVHYRCTFTIENLQFLFLVFSSVKYSVISMWHYMCVIHIFQKGTLDGYGDINKD